MSLDHKFPQSRFPEKSGDIDNFQWVAREVNESKCDLTHDEFVAICSLIARRFPAAEKAA